MYEPKYSADVAFAREALSKLDELDNLLRESPMDVADWENTHVYVVRIRTQLTKVLRSGEMGLWEQNGYPTMPRGV